MSLHLAYTLLLLGGLGPAIGCTHMQLRRSTVRQATTLTELQYQQVLNNLAMFICDPYALPSHVAIKAGTTQAADTGTGGVLPGGSTSSLIQPAITGTRTVVEQWNTVPITDDTTLGLLQMAYRNALGCGEYLDEKEANELAHALVGQLPTTADTSIEGNVLYAVMNRRSRCTHGNQSYCDEDDFLDYDVDCKADKVVMRVDVCGTVCWKRAVVRAGRVTLEGEHDLGGAARSDMPSEKSSMKSCGNYFECEIKVPHDVKSCIIDKDDLASKFANGRLTLSLKRTPHPSFECHEIPCDDWRNETLFEPGPDDAREGKRISQEFFGVMQSLSNTLDWQIVQCSDGHKPFFTFKGQGSGAVPSGLSQEVIYEVNVVQETLLAIPSRWFHAGKKRQVPKTACYVGQFHDRYVWVDRAHTKDLASFTIAVLKLSSLIRERQVVNAPSGVQFSPGLTRP